MIWRRFFIKKLFQPTPPANMQGVVSTILWSSVGPTLPTISSLPPYSMVIVTGPPDIAYVLLNGVAGPEWVQIVIAT